jgi:hypothetical protein
MQWTFVSTGLAAILKSWAATATKLTAYLAKKIQMTTTNTKKMSIHTTGTLEVELEEVLTGQDPGPTKTIGRLDTDQPTTGHRSNGHSEIIPTGTTRHLQQHLL